MKHFGVIYKVTNLINNKIYIGQTIKSLNTCKRGHFSDARNNRFNGSIFLRAINKYSHNNFFWEELCECFSRKELDIMENFYICFYKSKDLDIGYNLIQGRGRSGYVLSEDSRKKISRKAKERLSIPENNPMYGKSVSDICGNKISKALKNHYLDNCGTFTNRKHSEKSKKKMSISRTGSNNHFYGKELSKEHKQKISNSLKGRVFSEEHKKKLSNTRKGKRLGSENKGSKRYIVTTPLGGIELVHGLAEFCRQNNLSQGHMSSCATGKRKTHKGYACRYYEEGNDLNLLVRRGY